MSHFVMSRFGWLAPACDCTGFTHAQCCYGTHEQGVRHLRCCGRQVSPTTQKALDSRESSLGLKRPGSPLPTWRRRALEGNGFAKELGR